MELLDKRMHIFTKYYCANSRYDKNSMSKNTCPEPGDIRIIKGEWRECSRIPADDG